MSTDLPRHEPVVAIVPITDTMRAEHHLPPAAVLAVVERHDGITEVCCTDRDCVNGVEAAARSWAEAMGAAYAGRAA